VTNSRIIFIIQTVVENSFSLVGSLKELVEVMRVGVKGQGRVEMLQEKRIENQEGLIKAIENNGPNVAMLPLECKDQISVAAHGVHQKFKFSNLG
jgi:hypothetical protein